MVHNKRAVMQGRLLQLLLTMLMVKPGFVVAVAVAVAVVLVGSRCNSSDTCGLLTITETKRGSVGM